MLVTKYHLIMLKPFTLFNLQVVHGLTQVVSFLNKLKTNVW